MHRLLIISVCWLFPLSLLAQKNPSRAGAQLLQNASLVFVENKGQITDQHGKPRHDIKYKLNGNGLNVFIGNGKLHYQFTKVEKKQEQPPNGPNFFLPHNLDTSCPAITTYRIDVSLAGANKNAELIAEQPQSFYERYYLPQFGKDGLAVHSYTRLTYKNIYPNIDWVLYTKNNQLEYDFVVHPGGDPSKIKLSYSGAKPKATQGGDLIVSSPLGNITEQKPTAYEKETGKDVVSQFKLNKNILGFSTAQYNGTLVIDPKLQWATYYNVGLQLNNITTDPAGNLYMGAGLYSALQNTATSGAFRTSFPGGNYDAFITKFSSTGSRIWATHYGGGHSFSTATAQTVVEAITCDKYGNVYFTGYTSCDTGIATSSSFQSSISEYVNSFLVKLDNMGMRQWATYFGGHASIPANWLNLAYNVACDTFGNVYIGGETCDSSGIASPGAYQTKFQGWSSPSPAVYLGDLFLAKFNSYGNRVWSTYCGGKKGEFPMGLSIDPSGNIFLVGYTYSDSGIATPGSFQDTGGKNSNGTSFFAKFDSSGNRLWASYYGAFAPAIYNSACDHDGNLYLCGMTSQHSGLATSRAYKTAFSGSNATLLTKFTSNGNLLWSTYYGGDIRNSYSYSVSCDSDNNVFIVGDTYDTVGIATPGAFKTKMTNNTMGDAFVAGFSPLGVRLWGTYYGGNSWMYPYAITSDNGSNIFISGGTQCTDSITTPGSYQQFFDTANLYFSRDAFIVKFERDTSISIRQPYTDTVFCPGATWRVAYKVDHALQSGNVFTAQLSNASGSFASPVNIGSLTSTVSDTITCTIPISTPPGSGYRIRVVSSSPFIIGTDDYYDINIVSSITALTAINSGPVCAGTTLQFAALSTPSGLHYSWTGPAGFTGTSQRFNFIPAAVSHTGTYYVAATAPGCNTLTDSTIATVKPTPATPSPASNSPLCVNDTLYLTATDTSSGITWHWSGPSFTSLAKDTFRIPAVGGTYIVWATLNNCNSAIATLNVTTNYTPSRPSISSIAPLCTGDTLHLHATDTSLGVSWHWSGPGGFTALAKDTFVAPALLSGIYKAWVSSSNGCLSLKDSIYATVKLRPSKPVAKANSPICSGDSLLLTAKDTSTAITFHWLGPSFAASHADTVRLPAIAGTYVSWVSSVNGCVSVQDTVVVIVKPAPSPPTVASSSPVCSDSALHLFSSASALSPVTFHWSGPLSFTAAIADPIVMPPVAGTYKVWIIDTNGCASVANSTDVVVKPAPAKPGVNPVASICIKDTLRLFATDSTAGVQFHWLTPLDSSTVQNPVYYPPLVNGNYIVWASLNGCNSAADTIAFSSQATKPLSVIILGPAKFIYPVTIDTFRAVVINGGPHPTFQWSKNYIIVPGDDSDMYVDWNIRKFDRITVKVLGSDSCTNPDATATIKIGDIQYNSGNLILYPTPNNGNFFVKGNFKGTNYKDVHYYVCNVIGQILYSNVTDINDGFLFIQTSLSDAFAQGTYFFHISVDQEYTLPFTILK